MTLDDVQSPPARPEVEFALGKVDQNLIAIAYHRGHTGPRGFRGRS
jgi:hypothetical protein